jgi:isoquinoline 1-oxidoreductase
MNDAFPGFSIEPERYELQPALSASSGLDRREFFEKFGAGILILLLLDETLVRGQESGTQTRGRFRQPLPQEIGAWLHIGEDGMVTVYTGKTEIGQNIRTSLTQVVSEELRVAPGSVRLVMADTGLTPFDAGTFGSQTTPVMAAHLRKVSAACRGVLLDKSAERLGVNRSSLTTADGQVVHAETGRRVKFGALAAGQKIVATVQGTEPVTPPAEWKIAGTSLAKVNGRDFVTGKHRYTSDLKLEKMLYGKVLRPSGFKARLASVDTAEAEKIPGVTVVRDGDFIGVAALTPELASAALKAIQAKWETEPQPSRVEIFEYLRSHSSTGRAAGAGSNTTGSVDQAFASADKKLSQTYTVAYIAHAPLEPRAALAEWKDSQLTVWTGTQRPFGVRSELAEALRIPEERVRVVVPDTGSGYGGKHTGDAAVEAARLARGAGKPVKLVWTREEEFTWAYFRPAGVIEIRSGVQRDGKITAWEFHNYNSGASAIRGLYDIANQKIEFHPSPSPLRQGSYRALAATANHFARETHMDELAVLVGLDPLEFRLRNLKDPRLRAVLEAAAKRFGWGSAKGGQGRGFGIAAGFEKGSYIATAAEVSMDAKGSVRVARAVSAFECGAVLNPDHLRNQIEGAMIQGLGGALFEAVDFADGRILNATFSKYRVPRFSDAPPLIDVVLLDRKDLPSSGAGETPIVGIAPAVGNAIFDATGMRLRSLPLAPAKLAAELYGLKQAADYTD